jgi:uncharacterized protein (DUF362 family)
MEGKNFKVCVGKVGNISGYNEIKNCLYGILNKMRDNINIIPGGKALIKLNLCLLKGPETGATVDPRVAKALTEWLLENYDLAKIWLAEADATHLGAEMAFKALGWYEFFKDMQKVEFLNLSKDDTIAVEGRYIKDLRMSKTMMKVDFLISLAKLKTHTQQKITCIMKNQFGAIPYKYKIVYHPRLAGAIYDATAARFPDLCIIDGLIAMEGNGPTNGVPRRTGLLLSSNDAISMDHYCARLMGFRPTAVPHLRLAINRNGGPINYEILGGPPKPMNLKFLFLPKWKEVLKKGIGLLQRNTINEEA